MSLFLRPGLMIIKSQLAKSVGFPVKSYVMLLNFTGAQAFFEVPEPDVRLASTKNMRRYPIPVMESKKISDKAAMLAKKELAPGQILEALKLVYPEKGDIIATVFYIGTDGKKCTKEINL